MRKSFNVISDWFIWKLRDVYQKMQIWNLVGFAKKANIVTKNSTFWNVEKCKQNCLRNLFKKKLSCYFASMSCTYIAAFLTFNRWGDVDSGSVYIFPRNLLFWYSRDEWHRAKWKNSMCRWIGSQNESFVQYISFVSYGQKFRRELGRARGKIEQLWKCVHKTSQGVFALGRHTTGRLVFNEHEKYFWLWRPRENHLWAR